MGNLLFVKVHSATIHDTKSGIFPALFAYLIYTTIKGYSADGGYRHTFEEQVKKLLNVIVDISIKIKSEGFHVIPKRWIVERTFAWLNWSRRLCKDFEITTDSEETMVKISHIHTLLKRL
jgi:transposase